MLSAQAQTLDFNTEYADELEAQSEDTFSFIAQEGQMLSFLVTSNALDPIIRIEDLNANVLMTNDDYQYPVSRNALIEAFSAPYTGSYTLIVRGYGDTAGPYVLRMFPGYSQVEAQDTFDGDNSWQTVDVGSENAPEIDVDDGILYLTQEGLNERALALGLNSEADVYYVKANFRDVSGSEGWRVGLLIRYQDVFNYYGVFLNHNGAWRMIRVEDGEETVLRDWGIHPAIRAGVAEFSLSVLVNKIGYDIFYNEQFIGSQVDDTLTDGQVGFVVNTLEALGSTVTAQIDELIITTPVQVDNAPLFPLSLTATNSTYTAHELERRLVIPSGGAMALNIPESFAQQVEAGVSRFPIASETEFSNFIMGATISWRVFDDGLSGCGLVVRDTGNGNDLNYVLAYVDSAGGYGLSVREGETFTENVYNENPDLDDMPYQLLLIAVEDDVYFYLDGNFVGSASIAVASGGIGEAVVNFETSNTECRFTNLWVWTWD